MSNTINNLVSPGNIHRASQKTRFVAFFLKKFAYAGARRANFMNFIRIIIHLCIGS